MEDFVNFDIAKKLKEKGFQEECLCHYVGKNLVYNIERPITNNQLWFCHNKYDNIWHRYNIDAPTISQVLNWLRKEKKIYVSVEVEREDWFEYKIVQTTKNTRCNSTRVYETYDDAMIEGIKYVLYNLI
jgi:hypothetical protein